MRKSIKFVFSAEEHHQTIDIHDDLNYERFISFIQPVKKKMEKDYNTKNLKVFLKQQLTNQKYFKYINWSKTKQVEEYLSTKSNPITVQFFYQNKEETFKKVITKIGNFLEEEQKKLGNLTNELKDEANQIYATEFIRRKTSKDEETIEVFLIVSDPLVQLETDVHKNTVYNPLFHHQIDIPNHIQRLRKASLSNTDLTIKAKRVIGRKQDVIRCLRYGNNGNHDKRMFTIVQFFTRVQNHNGKLMISLQEKNEPIGRRVWVEAEQLFKEEICADIIIFIGVGVNLLKRFSQEQNISHCLILITTISIEDKPMLTHTQDRNFLDVQNSYHDKYCQTFLEEFYSRIFKRIDLKNSFRQAENQARNHVNKNIWCCCLHEHDANCNWKTIARRIGEPQVHRLLKHSVQSWNTNNYFQDRRKLQVLLLGEKEQINSNGSIIRVKPPPCGIDSTCCHQKINRPRMALHTDLRECIIWNGKQSEEMYIHLEQQYERPNRFQSETYDKPSGRRRPLTIFKLVEHITKNQISIIRSQIVSTIKRDFNFAKQYIISRLPNIRFYEFENSSYQIRKKKFKQQIKQYIIEQKGYVSKIGASIKSRSFSLYIYFLYNESKGERYYQKILDQYRQLTFQFPKIKFKLILLIKNVNFSNLTLNLFKSNKSRQLYSDHEKEVSMKEINLTKSVSLTSNTSKTKMNISYQIEDEPYLLQRYYDILSRHSFDSIVKNLPGIARKIQYGQLIDDNIRETMVEQLKNSRFKTAYLFIGFLNEFTDDGFYLNEVNRIILSKLFNQEILQDALNGKLPVQHINLPGCTYIQLHKSYRQHFKNPLPYFKQECLQKKLQFYYMLMRLYFQFWPQSEVINYPGVLRHYINKEGIFSIDIEREKTDYDNQIEQCKKQIKQKTSYIDEVLFNIENSIHIYHLNQVQKILQEFLKKKKNRHNPTTSKSYINPSHLGVFQYLLWNIVHKTWLMGLILSRLYQQEVKHFQTVLLIFLVQVQIVSPISQIARVQIHVLMHKYPPKREEIDFAPLTQFLKFYRNYAYQDMLLADLVPQWGNHCKFNDLFGTCCKLVSLISESIDQKDNINNLTPQSLEKYTKFKDYLHYKHKMFESTNSNKWALQSLKLVERKILYYFSFSNEFKKNQSFIEYQEKLMFFQKYFKLKWIQYQFNNFLHKLPENRIKQDNNTKLIQLYLNVQLNQPEQESKQAQKLEQQMKQLRVLKGKISPQYLPIFNYLCQKFQQKTMFNVNGLIIFARARNLICDDKPYVFIRKRTLMTEYLGKVFKNKSLKISYFSLTEQTLKIFQVNKKNNKCQVLCMIMTVDAINENELLFEAQQGVKAVKMSIQKFAQKLNNCRIKILILCGKNSTKICERLKQIKQNYATLGYQSISTSCIHQNSDQMIQGASSMIKSKIGAGSSMLRSKINSIVSTEFPSIIAIQSKSYSLSDAYIYQYKQQVQSQRSQRDESLQRSQNCLYNKQSELFEDIKEEQVSQDSIQEKTIDNVLKQSLEQDQIQINLADASGRNVLPTAILKRAESAQSIDLHNGVQKYLGNQVNSIAMDLIILAIVKNVTNKLSEKDYIFNNQDLQSVVLQSKKTVKKVLSNRFQCTSQVFQYIGHSVWSNNTKISKISRGIYQDLTKRFYCSQCNLHDQDYYQNIGNCLQIGKILDAINYKKINCIEIFGNVRSGKSSLLQQICWICQSKNLFRFCIIKVNINDPNFEKITERVYKQRTNKKNDTGVLIAIDDVNDLKQSHRQILKKLGGKSITIIYTTNNKQSGEELRKLVQVAEYQCINLDERQQQEINNQVYASLLSHIKEKNEFMYTEEFCKMYQLKVNHIMKAVKDQQNTQKLKSALDLLRVGNQKSQQERSNQFLYFYKQNYEELLNSMEHNRQIKIKFV